MTMWNGEKIEYSAAHLYVDPSEGWFNFLFELLAISFFKPTKTVSIE